MVQSVLGSLILGYRPLWNRARKLAAIQLYVHSEASALVDTAHLLRTLQELWSASSPPILLSPQSHQLLSNMLEHAPRGACSSMLDNSWWLWGDSRIGGELADHNSCSVRSRWAVSTRAEASLCT